MPTQAPTQPLVSVVRFQLINTADGTDLGTVNDGDTLKLSDYTTGLSLRAITEATAGSVIGSVTFFVNNIQHRVEQHEPYALASNVSANSNSAYHASSLLATVTTSPFGLKIEAVPFGGPPGAMSYGKGHSITIHIVAGP